MPDVLAFPAVAMSDEAPIVIVIAGAGKGLNANARAFARAAREINNGDTSYIVTDLGVQKVMAATSALVSLGVSATHLVGHAEQVLAGGIGGMGPVVVQVDQLATLARILITAVDRTVIAYILLGLPSQHLLGLRMVFTSADAEAQRRMAFLCACLSTLTRRTGADALFGPGARSSHRAAEPLYRSWISSHLVANLPKIACGLTPVAHSVEATIDGRRTMALFPLDHRDSFRSSEEVAEEVLRNPDEPILRGEDVTVGEVGPEAVRFHFCRERRDGQLAHRRGTTFENNPEAARTAILHAERETITKRNPLTATD